MGKQRLTTPSGRPASFGMRVRERVQTSKIVNMMHEHLLSEDPNKRGQMTSNDIQIAKILLAKTVPDLKAMEVQQSDGSDAKTITNQQLVDVIEGQARRIDND